MRLLLTLLFLTLLTFANNKTITIIDNKVKRVVSVDNSRTNNGFIIDFKKGIAIDKFALKYHLKLKKKMQIGLYIFNNNSNKSDLVLLKEILKNDKENIKSIFINIKSKNYSR